MVNGSGDLAAGLVVTRSGAGSAVGCDRPVPEQWFTGVGASAEHSSTLTLVNPDKGPAVADVTVWDGSALVDVPALRGVRVPGGAHRVLRPRRGRPEPRRPRAAGAGLARPARLERGRPGRPRRARPARPRVAAVAGRARHDVVRRRGGHRRRRPDPDAGQPRRQRGAGDARAGERGERVRPVGPRGDRARAGLRERGRPVRRAARQEGRGRPGDPGRGDRTGHRVAAVPDLRRPRDLGGRAGHHRGGGRRAARRGQAPRRRGRHRAGRADAAGLGRGRRGRRERAPGGARPRRPPRGSACPTMPCSPWCGWTAPRGSCRSR